ncbi:MAG: NUDIX domain-containing protein [Planctomycetes bacterium]|nr:NUDIX domain-containing protein [Planctomycetota bacterium]
MTNIKTIIEQYLSVFKTEQQRLKQLKSLVKESQNDNELVSREEYVGHITASGFVISTCRKKILLLRHKKLDLYLQPGGHFQPGDQSPLDVAWRKIREETGLNNLDYLPYHFNDEVPIDIDSHQIRGSHGERNHFHHDFRYLFLCNCEEDIKINNEKFYEFKWDDINELMRLQTFTSLKEKIDKTLSEEFRPKIFFDRLTKALKIDEQFNTIVVTHLLPDVLVFLRTINKLSNLLAVFPKPKSIDRNILEEAKTHFTIYETNRESLQKTSIVSDLIKKANGKVILLDIGGYFAPMVNNIAKIFPDKLIGVIEDTENGHQKYEQTSSIQLPIYSVARSPLKDNEDFLVGQSVLFSADAILREVGKLIQYLDCSVFGFGKIGSSIAHHLLLRNVKVAVYDKDPIRRMAAANRLCKIPERKYIINNSDVIFCATGGQVLDIQDFRALKPGCVVFSVTSSDDEMDLRHIEAEYHSDNITEHVTRYSSFSNHFYLVNKGNAVNFIHKAALGNFIHIVRGEMLYAIKVLLQGINKPGIQEISAEQRCELANLWLRTFADEPTTLRKFNVTGI